MTGGSRQGWLIFCPPSCEKRGRWFTLRCAAGEMGVEARPLVADEDPVPAFERIQPFVPDAAMRIRVVLMRT